MNGSDQDPIFEHFEETGEDQVRSNLAASRYNHRKAEAARLWLQTKAQKREESQSERNEASSREQILIARSAKNAAWAAAIAAIVAATAAVVTIMSSSQGS